MFSRVRMILMFFVAVLLAPLMGCGDDDDGPTGMTPDETVTFTATIENLATVPEFPASGVFDTPVAKTAAGPLLPGEAYEFTFGAAPGSKLSFATMFVQSNDLFYSPDGEGIALFDGSGNGMSGNVTDQIDLWDSGTEENEEPGVGSTQAPRQAGPNDGPNDSDNMVRLVNDGFAYPATGDVIDVQLTHMGENIFMLRIENISIPWTTSEANDVDLILAPGAFVIHTENNPLFTSGMADRGEGLEALAEDGGLSDLMADLDSRTGVSTPLAPGVWVVHMTDMLFFTGGQVDYGEGLKALAEDGDPSGLAASIAGNSAALSSGVFNTPVGAGGPGALLPGASYQFTFDADPGDRISFATMFVQSNDLFYGTGMNGMELFDSNDDPVTGDITSMVFLWDAGTEANQWPGAGPDQAPRQSGANTGMADTNDVLRMVNDGYDYPAVGDRIKVTLTTQ